MLNQLFALPQDIQGSVDASVKNQEELNIDFKEEIIKKIESDIEHIEEIQSLNVTSRSEHDALRQYAHDTEFLRSLQSSLESVQKHLAHGLSLIHARLAYFAPANPSETQIMPVEVQHLQDDGTVVEGSFDGQHMIGVNGKQYTIPANYASKSKLVEGDTLKLTIMPQGSFIYKQIRPVDRRRLLGTLELNADTREYSVRAENRAWRVLTASITYYKGVMGDEVAIIIPKEQVSAWAAVEHVIKRVE